MASVHGILNIQSLNELTYEKFGYMVLVWYAGLDHPPAQLLAKLVRLPPGSVACPGRQPF
jgi:hypothetical protein